MAANEWNTPSTGLRTWINEAISEALGQTGAITAANVSATPVGPGTATDVQGVLEELNTRIVALEGA